MSLVHFKNKIEKSHFYQTRLDYTGDEPNHTRQGPKRDLLLAERSEKSICKMESELGHRARNTESSYSDYQLKRSKLCVLCITLAKYKPKTQNTSPNFGYMVQKCLTKV